MIDSQDEQINLTHTKKLGTLQFQFYCKSQPELCHLIFKIQNMLKQSPSFYYHSILMINRGRPIESIQKRLKKQLSDLGQNKSFFQVIQKAINARQKCLQKLRLNLIYAQKKSLKLFKKHYFTQNNNSHNISYMQYVQNQGYSTIQVQQTIQQSIQLLQKVFTDMSRLRDMTIYIVEMVHQWGVKMEEWLDKCGQWEEVRFYYSCCGGQKQQLQNVYEKITKDTQFIWQSALNQHILISTTNDPFIIRNVLAINQLQQKQKTLIEKYFLQYLYPKSEQVIQKAIRCFQMLMFKYTPKVNVLKKEEEELIESYLEVRRRQMEEEGNVGVVDTREVDWQRDRKRQRQVNQSNNNKDKIFYPKGWMFGNKLKKPTQQRIQQLIQRHQHKVTFIKPIAVIVDNNKKNSNKIAINNTKSQRIKNLLQSLQHTKLGFNTNLNRFSLNKNNIANIIDKQDNLFKSNIRSSTVKNHDTNSRLKRSISDKQVTKHRRQHMVMMKSELLMPITHNNKSLNFPKATGVVESNHSPLQKMYHSLSKLQQSSPPLQTTTSKNIATITTTIFQHPHEYNQQQTPKNNKNQNNNKLKQIKVRINQYPFVLNKEQQQNQKCINQANHQQKQQLQTNQQRLQAVRQLINIYNKSTPKIQQKQKKSKQNVIKSPTQLTNEVIDSKDDIFSRVKRRSFSVVNNFRQRQDSKLAKNYNNKIIKPKSLQRPIKQENNLIAVTKQQLLEQKIQPLSKAHNNINPNKFNNNNNDNIKNSIDLPKDKILLKPKSIPFDIIPTYMLHIFNRLNSTSKKFTLYNLQSVTNKLINPLSQHILFDVSSDLKGHVGHVILSQSLDYYNKTQNSNLNNTYNKKNNHNKKLIYYTIEFININSFQLFISTIIKVSEEILLTTPCQQVRFKLYEDKLDAVSSHFVGLIEDTLQRYVKQFGIFVCQQTQSIKYNNTEMTEKLLTIKSSPKINNKKIKLQQLLPLGRNNLNNSNNNNYRSLRFQCRCLILGSNSRMRTRTSVKDIINTYDKVSMGYLYVRILARIVLAKHLKEVRSLLLSISSNNSSNNSINSKIGVNNISQSEYTNNQQDHVTTNNNNTTPSTTTKIIGNNNINKQNNSTIQFIRTSMMVLKKHLQTISPSYNINNSNIKMKMQQQQQQHQHQHQSLPTNLTKFTHMPQLLSYLQYKQYTKYFNFSFLQQSPFMLNHQLLLTQFQVSFSLQFIIQQSINMLILNNYMNKLVRVVVDSQQIQNQQSQQTKQQFKITKKCVILPTTNQNIELCFIDGKEYVQLYKSSLSQLDLFTYLYHYQSKHFSNINNNNKSTQQQQHHQQSIITQIAIPKLNINNQHNKSTIKMFNGMFKLFPQRQFYSVSQFKTLNLSQGYYPPAVLYTPQKDAVVFEYPLIVGVVDVKTKEIVNGFLFDDDGQ